MNFVVDSRLIDKYFGALENKNPFNLEKALKEVRKKSRINSNDNFIGVLTERIQVAYKQVNQRNILYKSKTNQFIVILKFRMEDDSNNSGKSKGWRIISLVDNDNDFFYLLNIYSHSQGKDNLTNSEMKSLKLLCDEYAKEIT